MSTGAVRARKRFNRVFLTWFGRTILAASRVMPYRLGVALGGVLGRAAFLLLPHIRRRAFAHLSSAFPSGGKSWVRRTALRSSIHLGKALLEMMLMTPERLRKVVTVAGDGVGRLRQAIGQGRGIVYVTAHIGNWEIMGGTIASIHPVSVIAAPIEPEPVNEMIVGLRSRLKVRTIVRDRPGASRELIRVFRENRVLGILIDQDTDVDGAFVDFFGTPAWTPTAAAQMALKFNAPVVFGYVHRESDTRHEVHIEGPLELVRTGDEKRDVLDNTALFTKMIENAIRKRPEQWVWMHRRWRRQP